MSIVQAVILGIVQGATEFIPVSRSGHLAILENLMDLPDVSVLFDVILHLCTLAVVVVFFRRRLGGMFSSLFRFAARRKREEDGENLRLVLMVIGSTAVTACGGFVVSLADLGKRPGIVSLLLIVTGVILLLGGKREGSNDYRGMRLTHALFIGAAQGIGVFPGISRSGITISAGSAAGLERERAGEYAFILSIPAILGALLLSLREAEALRASISAASLAAGSAAAVATGFLSLSVLMRIVKGGRLSLFSWYLIPAGAVGFTYFTFFA